MRRVAAGIRIEVASMWLDLASLYEELNRRCSHEYTYQELEELIFKRTGVIVSPQTIVHAAQTAFDLGLISQRALNRVLARRRR